jgi:hypothetical protein
VVVISNRKNPAKDYTTARKDPSLFRCQYAPHISIIEVWMRKEVLMNPLNNLVQECKNSHLYQSSASFRVFQLRERKTKILPPGKRQGFHPLASHLDQFQEAMVLQGRIGVCCRGSTCTYKKIIWKVIRHMLVHIQKEKDISVTYTSLQLSNCACCEAKLV